MARNRWSINGSILSVTGNISGTFDLSKVSSNWETLDDTEKFLVTYGAKQWLSDKLAGSSDPAKDLTTSWKRMQEGDFSRQSGSGGGVTKKQLVHENERLQQELAELKEMLAGMKNPAVKLKKK